MCTIYSFYFNYRQLLKIKALNAHFKSKNAILNITNAFRRIKTKSHLVRCRIVLICVLQLRWLTISIILHVVSFNLIFFNFFRSIIQRGMYIADTRRREMPIRPLLSVRFFKSTKNLQRVPQVHDLSGINIQVQFVPGFMIQTWGEVFHYMIVLLESNEPVQDFDSIYTAI